MDALLLYRGKKNSYSLIIPVHYQVSFRLNSEIASNLNVLRRFYQEFVIRHFVRRLPLAGTAGQCRDAQNAQGHSLHGFAWVFSCS